MCPVLLPHFHFSHNFRRLSDCRVRLYLFYFCFSSFGPGSCHLTVDPGGPRCLLGILVCVTSIEVRICLFRR